MNIVLALKEFMFPSYNITPLQLEPEVDAFKKLAHEVFTLNDGTSVTRAYPSDSLEEKRIACLNKMGSVWLHHPANRVQRKAA